MLCSSLFENRVEISAMLIATIQQLEGEAAGPCRESAA
jgi:hypothetical protein